MKKYTGLEIAVIGMSCRFPGADSIKQFWENLQNGVNCISMFTDAELLEEGEPEELFKQANYVKANGCLASKAYFDSDFFGYRQDEARLMDPQIRVYHECCWEAIEDSGYSIENNQQKTGIFTAASVNVPWVLYAADKSKEGLVDEFTAGHLRDVNFVSSSIAYRFNLKGPAVMVNTACSSSLVAIHEACNSLLLGECSMALAGGVNIRHFSKKGYISQEGMILSKDGKCRPFDSQASGMVPGEGAGVVVLKRLKDAIKDNDHIYAVIKGTAINNDGNNKIGYTAPGVHGQAEAIQKAIKLAGVEPGSISYIETHGTATKLGDSIEVEALNKVFSGIEKKQCAIGSVKSNIGHLDTAAGVAGFIKTVLAIKNRQLPATLNFTKLNPDIDFEGGPFYVNGELQPWMDATGPLRAGISSFGIGGTNAHMIIEEAPVTEPLPDSNPFHLMVLTGKTAESLEKNTQALKEYLHGHPGANLADVAYTLQNGRNRFKHRRIWVCESVNDAVSGMEQNRYRDAVADVLEEDLLHNIFLFPGQGTQYSNMCADLYCHNKRFRQKMDECFFLAEKFSARNFREVLFPPENTAIPETVINDTAFAQPLIFIVEYVLAEQFIHWGIKPDYMIGHSIGEYVAACISGVLSLEDALKLVIRRGELMGQVQPGCMLSVNMTEAQLEPLLAAHTQIDLAVINSTSSLVVAGREEDVEAFEIVATGLGFEAKKLHTSHAFHSRMMDDILNSFEEEVASVTINHPQIPYISNITGQLASYDQIRKTAYWSSQIRSTVRFSAGAAALMQNGKARFLELGPGRTLINHMARDMEKDSGHTLINSIRQAKQIINDQAYLLEKIGECWLSGIKINWNNFYHEEDRKRVSLPTYAFNKIVYPANFNLDILLNKQGYPNSGNAAEIPETYLYQKDWKRKNLPEQVYRSPGEAAPVFLVFAGNESFSRFLLSNLADESFPVIVIRKGGLFTQVNEQLFELDIMNEQDLAVLWKLFETKNIIVNHIIYCDSLDEAMSLPVFESSARELDKNYLQLSLLLKSIAARGASAQLDVTVVSNHLAGIMGDEIVNPVKACIHAPVAIFPSEAGNVNCRLIDIPYPFQDATMAHVYALKIIQEICSNPGDYFVAYRYKQRWVPHYENISPDNKMKSGVAIQDDGVYIITGGFGGMGFSIARDMAVRHNVKLVLVHRSGFPEKEQWDEWISENSAEDAVSKKITVLREMEQNGSHIQLYRADICSETEVSHFAAMIKKQYPKINGLVWAAGEIDYGGIILNRNAGDFIKYTHSKISGLLLFQKYFNFNTFDFLALFSSIGNDFYQMKFGQVAYNAANEFLESYASYAQSNLNTYVFTINWCDWLDVGMTVKSLIETTGSGNLNQINTKITGGVHPAEGVAIFYQCLEFKFPVYSIHKGNITRAIKENQEYLENIKKGLNVQTGETGVSSDTRDHLVESLTEIFRTFFSDDGITGKDDFFELGGDSLKAMTLVARINQKTGASLAIRDLYKHPVIKVLGEELQKRTINTRQNNIPIAAPKPFYAVSAEQKGMYFLQMYDPGTIAYNETDIWHIKGPVDEYKIREALLALIQRTEILRTSFFMEGDEPVQQVSESFEPDITFTEHVSGETIDLSGFIKPFDLSKAPLYRVWVIRKSSGDYQVITDSHHIVVDGVSKRIILETFKALYENRQLPVTRLQYKDYAEWQKSHEQRTLLEKQKAFWLNEYSELPPVPDLPQDFNRQLTPDYKGAEFQFDLSQEATKSLKKLASAENTSLFTVLLSAYTILLGKLGNLQDVVIGTPVSGRLDADLENMAGMFVNTLALRNYPLPELSFYDFLQQVKERSLMCFDHSSYPFNELVNELKIERNAARNPLFDVLFVYQKADEQAIQPGGLVIHSETGTHVTSRFDIVLSAVESNGCLYFKFVYAASLFKNETIGRFSYYFKQIISSVLNNVHIPVRDISILSPEEKHQLLVTFNNTGKVYHQDHIPGIIARHVQQHPGKTAVVCGNKSITYSALWERSDALAFQLMQNTKGDQRAIALLFTPSLEMIVSIFAVMKAGCAYVPLTPDIPAERIRFILQDCDAAMLLIQEQLYTSMPGVQSLLPAGKTLLIPPGADNFENTLFSKPVIRHDDIIYIIYTSGTTGNPKGVKVKHKGVQNYGLWSIDFHTLTANDVTLQPISFHFDGFGANFYPILMTGGTLVLIPDDIKFNMPAVAAIVKEQRVTNFAIVPGLYGTLLDSLEPLKNTLNLRFVFLGGETPSTSVIRRSRAVFPELELGNEYGPTETTITATHNRRLVADQNTVIGNPISNVSVYILGADMELLPAGVKGDLYIGGDGLAEGYVNNPQLTSERFIANPYKPGELLYKSGDTGNWTENGEINYAGRKDQQVKLRGFRIELAEIESALSAYEAIEEAVVQLLGTAGNERLVAYYTAPHTLSGEEISNYLETRLPAYMIPVQYIKLDQIPLTGNGKTDRKALPVPAGEVTVYEQPANAEEILLAGIWSKVLGRKQISALDDFFMIGGDSIKSIQISSRVQTEGYEVSVKDIFTARTIRKLAQRLRRMVISASQELVTGYVNLSPVQRWFFEGTIHNKHHFNQSVLLNFPKGISRPVVERIFTKLQEHHDALRMVFSFTDGEWKQENCGADYPVAVEEAYLDNDSPVSVQINERGNRLQAGTNIAVGPMMRAGLYHTGDGSRLLIVVHHLVIDGVSWRILFEDIETLCHQAINQQPLLLPAKSSSCQSWAIQLGVYMNSREYILSRKYWQQFTTIQNPALQRDYPNGDNSVGGSTTSVFVLSREATEQLLNTANNRFNTQATDLLLSALLLSLKQYYDQDLLLIDMEAHGREDIGGNIRVNRTIGWFTSIYPVLLTYKQGPYSTLLRTVKEQLRGVPANGIGYQLYKYYGQKDTESGKLPESMVSFNYLGQFDADTENRVYEIASEERGMEMDSNEKRLYDWDISGIVTGGVFSLTLRYSPAQYKKDTIGQFMSLYQEYLNALLSYCMHYDGRLLSPSDLTFKGLSIPELDALQTRYAISDAYLLSPMQEGMLFHSLVEDAGAGHYFGQMRLHIEGTLNVGAVEKSMNALADRYDILRTRFIYEGYVKPLQVVLTDCKIDFVFTDIRHLCTGESGAEEQIKQYQALDKTRNFDLSRDVLMRLTVLQTGETSYELIWSHHHILMDGWCMGIILNEFRVFYNQFTGKAAIKLPVPQPYSEYIRWLAQRDSNQSTRYWKEYLKGYKTKAGLPLKMIPENGLPANQTTLESVMSRKETRSMQVFCSQKGITLNTLLQTAWGILLSKYNGVTDVVFGSVVSGRPAEIPGIESMVGLFINTNAVRIHYKNDEKAETLLQRVQTASLDSEEHQYHPLAEIQAITPLGAGLFDSILAFENFPVTAVSANTEAARLNDFDISLKDVFESNHYHFTIRFYPEEELKMQFVYNIHRYEPAIIEAIPVQIKNIVRQIIADEETTIGAIELLTDEDHTLVENELSGYTLRSRSAEEILPVSPQQERLWFMHQTENGAAYHNIPAILNMEGNVQPGLLEKSINKTINRYRILRTRIIFIGEKPYQQTADSIKIELPVVNAAQTGMSPEALIAEAVNLPFDLDKQLVRAKMVKREDNSHTLILTVHHLVADRFSVHALLNEIINGYCLLTSSGDITETEPVLEYAAFSIWQQQAMVKLNPLLLGYWKGRLGNRPKAIELPLDNARTSLPAYTSGGIDWVIPHELHQAIKLYAENKGTDIGIILMAAFKILLFKYARHDEVVIGTKLNNRKHPLTENLIGPVENLVVISSCISAEATFDEYVQSLQKTYNEAVRYGDLLFDRLVSELAAEKQASRNPLFDVLFYYEDQVPRMQEIPALKLKTTEVNGGNGRYDLDLLLRKDGENIKGRLVFNREYFNTSTINTFLSHYLELLRLVTANPSEKIAFQNPVPEPARKELLQLLDNTSVPYPAEETIVTIFERQVKATPGNIAVCCSGRSLNYSELNKRANNLARVLKKKGVGANQIVGLFTERSIETIIGMLAILKAGGAYLPLDIDYPEERIRYIVMDSGISLMLTTKDLADKQVYQTECIFIDDAAHTETRSRAVSNSNKPSDLCYVIYTSGTTGNPKGVMVEHGNAVRLFFNEKFQFRFGTDDVWTMFHSHCFDFSVWEIYGALLFGGRLVVIPKMTAIDTPAFLKILKQEKVTILNQTPGAFDNLVREELRSDEAELQLKYVIFGGEALFPARLKGWHNRYPATKLVNMFGITETTVHVTYKEIGQYEIENNISNIGTPIPTLSVYILDEYMNPVPKGVPGELYVGGAGVSRGYLGKAQLTAERFVPNPFAYGQKLYRSGDTARLLHSGDIEYIGRMDNQVQLRGFRIELGEIENKLMSHGTVEKAVALLREKDGESYLIAYYVAPAAINSTLLRQYMTQKLPGYMVPSRFIHLESLPLTANGKLDRQSLPDEDTSSDNGYVSATTDIQLQLIQIWSEILGLEKSRISIHASFFELGGHSINIIRLNTMVNSRFGTNISVANMFRLTTIKMLEDFILNGDVSLERMAEEITGSVNEAMDNLQLFNGLN